MHAGGQLKNTALSQAAQMGPRVCSFAALHCTGEDALSTPWPWESVSVWDIGLAKLIDLLNMPLSSSGGRRTIHVSTILLNSSLTQVRVFGTEHCALAGKSMLHCCLHAYTVLFMCVCVCVCVCVRRTWSSNCPIAYLTSSGCL